MNNRDVVNASLEARTPEEFEDRVAKASVLLQQALDLLAPYLPNAELPEDLPGVPHEFPGAAASMLEAYHALPKAAVLHPGFDAAKIEADLRSARVVGPLANLAAHLATRIANHQRLHLTGAYVGILPLYRVAKIAATLDQSLQRLVTPLQNIFAKRR